ncbi:extracellular solute-binding protein [Pseudactinotalea sp. Z1732]|uniref:ABC transporter substrate-binding protein n=1 Tax=Pseudactinotalea sp. Z1732 TaxID=3413026 RepID=UPI003C7E51CD
MSSASRRRPPLWTPRTKETWTPSRRNVLTLGGAAATAGLLSACGGGPSVGGDTARADTTQTEWDGVDPAERITWWSNHPGNTMEWEQSMIDAFTAETGIEVELVTAGANYDEIAQRFQAASSTSEIPDLVGASDVWWFRYFVNGQIIPVDDLFAHLGVDTDDFVDTFYEDYAYEGLHYAVPYARSTPLFYYNRDMWEAAGLPDRGPETWEELAGWSEALWGVVPGEGAPLGLSHGPSWSAWWYSNVSWGLGAAMSEEWDVTLETEESIAAGRFVRDLYHGDGAYAGFSAQNNADFQAGMFASLVGSTGALTGHLEAATFELGAAFLPEGPVPGPTVPTGGTGIAIAADREPGQQLAGAMFLAFLTNAENTADYSAGTGYMPVRHSAIEGETMSALYEEVPQFRTSVDQLERTRTQDWVRVFTPGGDQIITDGLEEIILQGSDAEDVFPNVAAQLERAFSENVEPYL